ncbi:hypothetical protein ACHAXR_002087 [Thalassiosira sp. AJA248-18]
MATGGLLATSILLGTVHVLVGPDHLSALATLIGTNISSRSSHQAFLLGIKWGIGHSLALLVVGGTLIVVDEGPDWIFMDATWTTILEGFGGLFMLALGSYGLRESFRNRERGGSPFGDENESVYLKDEYPPVDVVEMPTPQQRENDSGSDHSSIIGRMEGILEEDDEEDTPNEEEDEDIGHLLQQATGQSVDCYEVDELDDEQFIKAFTESLSLLSASFKKILTSKPSLMKASTFIRKHATPENSITAIDAYDDRSLGCGFFDTTPSILALLAGAVHGVARTADVLGDLATLQLKDAKMELIYLGVFCLTSTFVMGGFAAFYGACSECLASGRHGSSGGRVFLVEVVSAFLSIAVGLVWLLLLSIGKLEQMYPL